MGMFAFNGWEFTSTYFQFFPPSLDTYLFSFCGKPSQPFVNTILLAMCPSKPINKTINNNSNNF